MEVRRYKTYLHFYFEKSDEMNIADIISCWSGTGTTTYGGVDEIARSLQRKDSPEKISVSSQDLKDKLEDVIKMLKNRAPHSDILDYLKSKNRNQLW